MYEVVFVFQITLYYLE